jgi:hypothetical protein
MNPIAHTQDWAIIAAITFQTEAHKCKANPNRSAFTDSAATGRGRADWLVSIPIRLILYDYYHDPHRQH